MTTFRQLSPSLRTTVAAPWLLIAAAIALGSTPAFRQVLIDAANQPTADVSLSSTHWTGTLDPARLPDGVPRVSQDGNLVLAPAGGDIVALAPVTAASGTLMVDTDGALYYTSGSYLTDPHGDLYYGNASILADASGNLFYATGNTLVDGGGTLHYSTGDILADRYGDLYGFTGIFVNLSASGVFSSDNENIYSDGYGDLSVLGGLAVSGDFHSPIVYTGNLHVNEVDFQDLSFLLSGSNQLVWTDGNGNAHVLATGN